MATEKRNCNQICRWNDSSDGCIKPYGRNCPMSNTEPDASGWGQVQVANEKRLIDYEQAKRATYEEIFWSESEQAVVRHFLAKLPKVDAVEVPPIKVGDTAYFIINRKIYKADVYFIRWEHHKRYGIHSEISANVGPYSSVGASFDDFGKTVFLTEEAAKEALAKMDGERREGE